MLDQRVEAFLVVCPTYRDHRELQKLASPRARFLFHDYGTRTLENLACGQTAISEPVADPLEEVDRILQQFRGVGLTGVISTDDYPGSTMAAVIARKLGLPGPDPAINLIAQHKYYSRLAQRECLPEAVPDFEVLDVSGPPNKPPRIKFPAFVKPVKSFLSIGAGVVSTETDLRRLCSIWAQRGAFFEPFKRLLEHYADLRMGTKYLLAETPLSGLQVTVEGYAYGDRIEVLGVVDSVMFPGTLAFQRFEYPSSLPWTVQRRMAEAASDLMKGLGYRDGMFNIEFIYDPGTDRLWVIEINPRAASQFADLHEKVDGTNSYSVLLALASGRQPQTTRRKGPHRFASSFVLRCFEDREVVSIPSDEILEAIAMIYEDVRIEVLTASGKRLSDEVQDGHSYRYAVINLGGRDRQEVLGKFKDCERRLAFAFKSVQQNSRNLA